jgi:hypothetical protein
MPSKRARQVSGASEATCSPWAPGRDLDRPGTPDGTGTGAVGRIRLLNASGWELRPACSACASPWTVFQLTDRVPACSACASPRTVFQLAVRAPVHGPCSSLQCVRQSTDRVPACSACASPRTVFQLTVRAPVHGPCSSLQCVRQSTDRVPACSACASPRVTRPALRLPMAVARPCTAVGALPSFRGRC